MTTPTGEICPACRGTATIPIEYGEPGEELIAASARGEVAIGGCIVWNGAPERRCTLCGHEWLPEARP